MALKLVIDKLEDVEEIFRNLYVPKDGKFVLDAEIEDNAPLRRNLEAARLAEKQVKKKVKDWEDLGKTPEEIRELLARQEQYEMTEAEREAERKGEWNTLRQQMNEKHAAEMKKKDDALAGKDQQLTNLRQQLESHLVDANATAAIAAEKGVPELLLPIVRKHVKVVEEDGKFQVQVLDDKGGPKVNVKGDPATIQELVAELKTSEKYGRAFEGSGQSGSGMPPAGGNGGNLPSGNIRSKADLKTEKDRSQFVDTHGLDAYKSLPV